MTISPVQSVTMEQQSDEIWTAETGLQPILPKSDRLLELLKLQIFGFSINRAETETTGKKEGSGSKDMR